MKLKAILFTAVLSLALVLGPVAANAAIVAFDGPDTVLPGEFTFDVILVDLNPGIDDLHTWNVKLYLSSASASSAESGHVPGFVGAAGPGIPDYVSPGPASLFDWGPKPGPGHEISFGDSAIFNPPTPRPDFQDKLLGRVTVDVSGAAPGEIFVISAFAGPEAVSTDLAFSDTAGNFSEPVELEDYRFQIVPIPGAVMLLGSGLLGLVAIRRRR
jgi:hypothetical protein